jgi:hypothetical protein
MIAIGLIFWDGFWRALIFGLVAGSVLMGCMFILQMSSILFTAPFAAILLRRQITEMFEAMPIDKLMHHVLRKVDQYIVATKVIRDRLAEIDKNGKVTMDSGLVDTLPIDNPMIPLVYHARLRRGKGIDDDMRVMIRDLFSHNIKVKHVKSFDGILPSKSSDPRVLKEYTQTKDTYRIVPFHVLSFARVDVDNACSILDSILQFQNIDEKTAKAYRDASSYMTKALHRFINEMVWYVYKLNIGPMLTPYMLNIALQRVDEEFLQKSNSINTSVTELERIGVERIMSFLGIRHLYPHACLRITSTEQDELVFSHIKELVNEIVKRHANTMLDAKELVCSNKFQDDNLGECTLTIIEGK